MDSPKHFHNFEFDNGVIRIRLNDRTLLCIPTSGKRNSLQSATERSVALCSTIKPPDAI
jgi:hypothetical protein